MKDKKKMYKSERCGASVSSAGSDFLIYTSWSNTVFSYFQAIELLLITSVSHKTFFCFYPFDFLTYLNRHICSVGLVFEFMAEP